MNIKFTSLALITLLSTVPMMGSHHSVGNGLLSWDTAHKLATVVVLVGVAAKSGCCVYNYLYKKKKTVAGQLKEVSDNVEQLRLASFATQDQVATIAQNQKLVMNTVFGIEGADIARHMKPTKGGLLGVAGESSPSTAEEFTENFNAAKKAFEEAETRRCNSYNCNPPTPSHPKTPTLATIPLLDTSSASAVTCSLQSPGAGGYGNS